MAGERMNGTDILLLVNTGTKVSPVFTAVGYQRDMSIERTRTWIDMSAKGDDVEYGKAGRRSYVLTLDAVYVPDDASYLALLAAWEANETIKVRQQENGIDTEEANGCVLKTSKKAPDAQAATISVEIRITGGWVEVGT